MSKKVVLFASGSGSNVENIVNFFTSNSEVTFPLVLCNKKDAFVFERAKKLGLESRYFTKEEFANQDVILDLLKEINPDLIVLAGFLWLVPSKFVAAFPNKIINIHPALLPKFGGKGMFGMYVHEAVVANKEVETGITIHYVNEKYDEGAPILQAICPVFPTDSAEDVAHKIHALEYEHFPKVIEKLLSI